MIQNATSNQTAGKIMSQNKCRFTVDIDVALPITSAGMKSLLTTVVKKTAWWLLVLLILLIGAWLCWLEYRLPATWPDFPWQYPKLP